MPSRSELSEYRQALILAYNNFSGLPKIPHFEKYNMRQKWHWALLQTILDVDANSSIFDFATAGMNYYHSKKFGVHATLMAKLDDTLIDRCLYL